MVGIPHPDFGEVVVAAVVPDGPETGQLNEEMVIRHVKDHLANFKAPKRVRFLPELPRNAMGKVEKTILRRFLDDQP